MLDFIFSIILNLRHPEATRTSLMTDPESSSITVKQKYVKASKQSTPSKQNANSQKLILFEINHL